MIIYTFIDALVPFLEAAMYFLLFEAALERRKNLPSWSYFFGVLLLAALIALSNHIFAHQFRNILCMMLAAAVVASVFYKSKLQLVIGVAVACLLVSLSTENLMAALISVFFNISAEDSGIFPGYRILGIFFSKGLGLAICNFFRIRNKKQQGELGSAYWILFFLLFSSVTLSNFLTFRLSFLSGTTTYNKMIAISCVGSVLIVFLSLFFYEHLAVQNARIRAQEQAEDQLKSQVKHLDDLLAQQKALAGFRHDLANQLVALEGFINHKDFSGMKHFVQNLRQQVGDDELFINTGNVALDAILSTKIALAKSKGIDFNWALKISQNLPIEDMDQCTIFGNALDNAIEACEHCSESQRQIHLVLVQKKDKLICKLTNSALTTGKFDLSTTKADKNNHGFGVFNLTKALEKYDSEPFYDQDDGQVTLNFIIYTS